VLRARRIRNLVFCGVALNVCVESTLREAYHREYFCLLLDDATRHAGPSYLREATLWNVERFFGWTAPVASLEAAVAVSSARASGRARRG
jgi:ureidoacrylate peracid hydrolase